MASSERTFSYNAATAGAHLAYSMRSYANSSALAPFPTHNRGHSYSEMPLQAVYILLKNKKEQGGGEGKRKRGIAAQREGSVRSTRDFQICFPAKLEKASPPPLGVHLDPIGGGDFFPPILSTHP